MLAFRGEIPSEDLPPIVDIPVASLVARRVIRTASREDHVVHVDRIPPSDWKTTPCEREGKK